MPITYAIDPESGVLTMEMSGDITIQEFTDYFDATDADPRFHSDLKRLIVLTHVTMPPVEELRRALGRIDDPRVKGARFAVVGDTPTAIGIHRMMFGEAGLFGQVRVFPDRASGLRWLLEGS